MVERNGTIVNQKGEIGCLKCSIMENGSTICLNVPRVHGGSRQQIGSKGCLRVLENYFVL